MDGLKAESAEKARISYLEEASELINQEEIERRGSKEEEITRLRLQ